MVGIQAGEACTAVSDAIVMAGARKGEGKSYGQRVLSAIIAAEMVGGTRDEIRKSAYEMVRSGSSAEVRIRLTENRELVKWMNDSLQLHREAFLELVPSSTRVTDALVPVPSAVAPVASLNPSAEVVMRSHQLLHALTASRKTNLKKYVLADWENKHAAIMHDACPPLADVGRSSDRFISGSANQKSVVQCWQRGFCICRGSGMVVDVMAVGFCKMLKTLFPPKTVDRTKLVNGHIVVHLIGYRPAVVIEDELDLALAKLGTDSTDFAAQHLTEYWSIGDMCLCPYEVTITKLRVEAHVTAPVRDDELQLKDCGYFAPRSL